MLLLFSCSDVTRIAYRTPPILIDPNTLFSGTSSFGNKRSTRNPKAFSLASMLSA